MNAGSFSSALWTFPSVNTRWRKRPWCVCHGRLADKLQRLEAWFLVPSIQTECVHVADQWCITELLWVEVSWFISSRWQPLLYFPPFTWEHLKRPSPLVHSSSPLPRQHLSSSRMNTYERNREHQSAIQTLTATFMCESDLFRSCFCNKGV